jgi:rhodanese-related sulfurtransferase
MATVYLANDVRHGRLVAIKVLEPELAAVLGGDRFLREIEIAAQMSHPHILPLYDSGELDGQLFYVMPYIEGESLRGRLERERQLPVADAIRLTTQVASALDYAHRRGIVHRDIKPENVMLHEGHALVADFGIALAVTIAGGDRLTGTGLSLGTPYYMSPEQAMGERAIDARSDVYSLACLLYEMLAGEPPFTGPTSQAVIARILTEQPRDLTTLRSSVTPALQRVTARALARLPADRFGSAREFAEELQRAGVENRRDDSQAITESADRRSPPPESRRGRRLAVAAIPWLVALGAIGFAIQARTGAPGSPAVGAPAAAAEGEISTEEMARIVAEGSAVVLDTRPHLEYAISHIPGALNVAARPGVPMSVYISDVAQVHRLVGGDTLRPIVLYCNGPYCPKTRRTATELSMAGFQKVLRYQLGIPVWRAFGHVTEIEADGLRHVMDNDRTAFVIDVRERAAFSRGSLPGAHNVPRSLVTAERDAGEIRLAKDDGRLPMHDHNTRVIVLGDSPEDARFVAQVIAHEGFHNVSYFPGTIDAALAALRGPPPAP